MDTVILDPIIPYVGPIGGGSFSPKKLVKLEGTIPPYAYGFDINLQCGPNTFPHDDIALQMVIRFTNGYLSLNSSQQGIWGKELRLLNVPIKADEKFKITVLCEFNQYKVAINNEHYCVFPQTIPCEKISHLSIDGDVSIIRISYESICDAISNTTTPLYQSENQFNHVQHSDLPPSSDTALNRSEDVKFQNSFLKATFIKGCKIILVFLCVIAVYAVFGGIIYLITPYNSNNTRSNSYNYHIPSIDIKSFNLDMDKNNKEADDALAEIMKFKEDRKNTDDEFAKARKADEDNKSYIDLIKTANLRYRNKQVHDALEKKKRMDKDNKYFSDLIRTRLHLKARNEIVRN